MVFLVMCFVLSLWCRLVKMRKYMLRSFFVSVILLFNIFGINGDESDLNTFDINLLPADDEQCISEINKLLANRNVSEDDRILLKYRLNALLKNRKGEKATDFLFVKKDGSHGSLYDVKGDYVLVFFYNPDCETCKSIKREIMTSDYLNGMLDMGRVKLLSVCVEGEIDEWKKQQLPELWIDACDKTMSILDDELYYLPGLPTLYLLDSNHSVLLKNTNVINIEKCLKTREKDCLER